MKPEEIVLDGVYEDDSGARWTLTSQTFRRDHPVTFRALREYWVGNISFAELERRVAENGFPKQLLGLAIDEQRGWAIEQFDATREEIAARVTRRLS